MLNKELASRYLKALQPIPTAVRKSGRRLPGIRAVLFDIYGTLLVSAAGDIGLTRTQGAPTAAIWDLIEKFKLHFDPPGLAAALTQAIRVDQHAKRQEGVLFPEVAIDKIWMQVLENRSKAFVRRFALEYELAVNPVYPMPYLKKVLQICCARNLKMGLISNAQFYTLELFRWFLGAAPEDLGFHPDLILLSFRLGHAKPGLVLFQEAAAALKTLDIPAAAALFIGNDMLNDILPAQRIGFKTALFAGDKRSLRLRTGHPCCRKLRPDIVITDLMQLFDFII